MDRRGKRIVKTRVFLTTVVLLLLPLALIYQNENREVILNVPYISQKGNLPTGCELVSASMVLKYYNVDVPLKKIVEKTPHSELKKTNKGLTGSHPAQNFIGDPNSPNGFGCYAPVVVSVMNSFLSGTGKKAADLSGTELEDLARTYLSKGNPVIIWATMNMREPRPGKSWILPETGETFQWIAGEHCLVLVGYNRDCYYFNDPYESNGLISFDKSLVEKRYETLGRQAVAVI